MAEHAASSAEASGTSGMKAAANGVLNLSTLDGWWDEVWHDPQTHDKIGWAIGKGEEYQDLNYQDQVEADALYDLLERDVVPTFYDRGADRIPRKLGRTHEGQHRFALPLRQHAPHGQQLRRAFLHPESRALSRAGRQ